MLGIFKKKNRDYLKEQHEKIVTGKSNKAEWNDGMDELRAHFENALESEERVILIGYKPKDGEGFAGGATLIGLSPREALDRIQVIMAKTLAAMIKSE